MTIREFAKLNNFPIKGKLTRIPDEVEYSATFAGYTSCNSTSEN